ncbi:ABC transporter permease [Heyndrickxia sporothermodurans]
MTQFTILMNKELVQICREFRIIWLPLVFIFLGATQPVMTYYLPSILKALGGGEGITIDSSMMQQGGGQVLATTIGSQFDQLGMMIVVVAMMGIIQSDKANGMLDFILTRPVTVREYLLGKVVSNYVFVSISVLIGYIVSYGYVSYLFTSIPLSRVVLALLIYLVWVLFIVSFTTMISTMFNSQGMIALISIVALLIYRMTSGVLSTIDLFNPAGMSQHAMKMLMIGQVDSDIYISLLVTIVWTIATLIVTYYWISQKKYHKQLS